MVTTAVTVHNQRNELVLSRTAQVSLEGVNEVGGQARKEGVSAYRDVSCSRETRPNEESILSQSFNSALRISGYNVNLFLPGITNLELVALDLAKLKSVRACADGLLSKGEPSTWSS